MINNHAQNKIYNSRCPIGDYGAPQERNTMEQTTSYNATYGFPISEIALRLLANLQANSLSLPDTDATSVIDLLYHTYTDCLGQDPQEIHDGFLALDNHLEPLTLDANNSVFCIVCELCGAYEKRAFKDALQLGAYLMLELQGQNPKTHDKL